MHLLMKSVFVSQDPKVRPRLHYDSYILALQGGWEGDQLKLRMYENAKGNYYVLVN